MAPRGLCRVERIDGLAGWPDCLPAGEPDHSRARYGGAAQAFRADAPLWFVGMGYLDIGSGYGRVVAGGVAAGDDDAAMSAGAAPYGSAACGCGGGAFIGGNTSHP